MSPDWPSIQRGLDAWHQRQDHRAGGRALAEIEQYLRARVAPRLRRRASPQAVEDVLQKVLLRLWERPLSEGTVVSAGYVATMARNAWVDRVRRRKREVLGPEPDAVPEPVAAPRPPEAVLEVERVAAALETLAPKDRVHVKICDAPHTLTWEELGWIAQACGLSAAAVRDRVLDPAATPYDLSFLVDPGAPSMTDKQRRDRMERFRRRRSRARQRLRAALGEP